MRVFAGLIVLASCTATIDRGETRIVPASALAWHAGRVVGLQSVDVWGDAETSAHGTLARFSAGVREPPHAHSRAFHVLVLAGTMYFVVAGQRSPPLTTGSYIAIAAGTVHFAECSPETSCEAYVEQDGPLDVTPAS